MALKIRTFFLYVSFSLISFAAIYLIFISTASEQLRRRRSSVFTSQLYIPNPRIQPYIDSNLIISEQDATATGKPPYDGDTQTAHLKSSNSVQFKHIRSIPVEFEGNVLHNATIVNQFENSMHELRKPDLSIANVSVLFPSWEALVIVSPEIGDDRNYTSNFCLFDTNEISPARFSGTMTYPDRKTYTCHLPNRVLRRLPFRQPILTKSPDEDKLIYNPSLSSAPELLRWNFIVYEVTETENDIVLLAKGINSRQGVNRSPTEFKCLFGDDTVNGVTSSVTSSVQEVFRCQRPDLTAFGQSPVKVSLLILKTKQVVPSLAYLTPQRKIGKTGKNSLLCACTMVYNVGKFLKEWVIYHSKIGVDKFILYDNGSDDDFNKVVDLLKSKGYDIETRFWLWPKTQEAGFSHAVLHAKPVCKWMMFIDVDEFVYSPSWASSKPSVSLLQSLLPAKPYGQLVIRCYEFGPSNQRKHPLSGVTQGYNCRKEIENRHKSIVLLEAVNESLLNVIHHFKLKDGYKSKKMNIGTVVVNHYKYQAWDEFKAKFRRRVSAYVVDWTRSVNLKSNDRAPGLGHLAVEPNGWEEKFCEVYDNRLKHLTRRWFGRPEGRSRFRMDWQNI